MKTFPPRETARVLPWLPLAEAIADVMRRKERGLACAPRRIHMDLAGGGLLLAMPAADDELAITKLVTVHPDNPAKRGLPTIQGEVLVMDARDGRRLGILDGVTVTARRTAALSLLAAMTLAPNTAGPLLLVGAGTQGQAHLEAFREGLGIEEVFISARGAARALELKEYAQSLGMKAHAVADAADAVERCPLIVTATTSRAPVLPERVRPDAFIAAVGAFRPDMAEIPAALVRSCAVYVDTLSGTREEAGDLLQANIPFSDVTRLADMLDEKANGDANAPSADAPGGTTPSAPCPVLFKSVGSALFDLAAARLAFMS